jgi:Ca2+-transporting ATPase
MADKIMWIVNLGTIVELAVIIYTPVSGFLKLTPLNLEQLLTVVGIAAASVLWYEIVKIIKILKNKKHVS